MSTFARNAIAVAICLFLLVSATKAQQAEPGETIVITGGTLIDGNGGTPLRNAEIVIQGGRFRSVSPKGASTYPSGAKVINADGKFLLPGLFDSHVHYRDWVGELLLVYGVTSIIDMGNPTEWILAVRDGTNKGKIRGPRVFASGGQLANRSPARNPEEARRTVRELIAKGVDKIAVTTTQTPDTIRAIVEEAEKAGIPISGYSMYPREAIALGIGALEHAYSIAIASKKDPAVLEEIRREQTQNLHRYEKNPLHYLVEEGTLDDFIPLLVQKGAYVIPDLAFDYKIINDRQKQFEQESLELLTHPNLRYFPFDDYLPQILAYSESALPRPGAVGLFGSLDRQSQEFQMYLKSYRNLQNFLRKLVQAGGKVLSGPDTPNMVMPGLALHHEIQLMVDAGLTPMQAIQSATKWPAMFMRKQKDLGTVEAGKIADLVILTANPLDDITNTQKIDMVLKDGQIVDRTIHPSYAFPIPRPESDQSQVNPEPVLRDVTPKAATEGDKEVVLKLAGQDFVRNAVVVFDGQQVPTTFVKHTELRAAIPARLLARVGTFPVAVLNPKPVGGMSNDLKFIVRFK